MNVLMKPGGTWILRQRRASSFFGMQHPHASRRWRRSRAPKAVEKIEPRCVGVVALTRTVQAMKDRVLVADRAVLLLQN
jgi:hypothetical protein